MYLNSKSIAKHINSLTEKLDSNLDTLVSKPGKETIHDIRTTTRRIQALTELLPKSIRKKAKVTTYLARSRALFKATTPIRDIDIIQSKLQTFEQYAEVKRVLEAQKERRENLFKVARKAANNLKETEAPRFKSSQISQSKLAKRKKKLTRKYQSLLARQMKILLAKPTIEQLHEFRKNCKMLRYTLEADRGKIDPLMKMLVKIQMDLGVVMDVQAVLNTILALPASEASTVVTSELNAEKEEANTDYLTIRRKLESSIEVVPKE